MKVPLFPDPVCVTVGIVKVEPILIIQIPVFFEVTIEVDLVVTNSPNSAVSSDSTSIAEKDDQ